MINQQRLRYLIQQQLAGTIVTEETAELESLVREDGAYVLLSKIIQEEMEQSLPEIMIENLEWEERIRQILAIDKTSKSLTPVHRSHFLKSAWIRYAAAIVILVGVGTYLYVNNQPEKPSVTQKNPVPMQNDVAPGGNRATLKLADGSTII